MLAFGPSTCTCCDYLLEQPLWIDQSTVIPLSRKTFKACFHLYMYVYICISVSHQDRLEDMKCFHSCICVSVIRLDRQLGVIQMDDGSISWPGLWQGPTNDEGAREIYICIQKLSRWLTFSIYLAVSTHTKCIG